MKRIWLITPWLVFLVLAVSWIFYWRYVESETRAAVTSWRDAIIAAGGDARCEMGAANGFPIYMRLALSNCLYAPDQNGWRIAAAQSQLHINLSNPNHIKLEALAPISLAAPDNEMQIISADALILSYRRAKGALAQAGLQADALLIDNPNRDGALAVEKLTLNIRPDPRNAADYQAALEMSNVALARTVKNFEEFGDTISALRTLIVVEHGALLFKNEADSIGADPLAPWRDAGGQARFEALNLNWGPLAAAGTGHVTIDAERRLQGHIDIDIDEPGPPIAALSRSQGIPKDARNALEIIATAFALTGQQASFDVEAVDGELTIEEAPVRSLAPIY